MKKIFILFIYLFFISCSSVEKQTNFILCPEILYSKNHRVYISSDEENLNVDNISYRAEINNAEAKCILENQNIEIKLSMLFVIEPKKAKKSEFMIPYFVALLDDKKNVLHIEYYKKVGSLDKNIENNELIETELIDTKYISLSKDFVANQKLHQLILGFMIDKNKLKILN
tara:strand:+ start:374 stop:886 length:513 start_codon:yes stop_codon:yes gene_type:complete